PTHIYPLSLHDALPIFDHPNDAGQVVVALMNSTVSDPDTLATDDIHGARALYPPAARYALNFTVSPPEAGEVIVKTLPDRNGQLDRKSTRLNSSHVASS